MPSRDSIILDILKRLEGDFRPAFDKEVWDNGWGEILDKINNEGFSIQHLKPQYFKDEVFRYRGDWYTDENQWELDREIRSKVFAEHLTGLRVVEIGCGTGINQLLLADICPELVAADWAEPSQEIIKRINGHLNKDIKPVNFDMFSLRGWDELGIDENTAILTVHALEQVGEDWGLLLTAIRKAKPRLCVHIEPLYELYDQDILFDYLAARYHRKRNYLEGYLPAIRELERNGNAEIMRCERLHFGGKYHEAYSVLVWKPI